MYAPAYSYYSWILLSLIHSSLFFVMVLQGDSQLIWAPLLRSSQVTILASFRSCFYRQMSQISTGIMGNLSCTFPSSGYKVCGIHAATSLDTPRSILTGFHPAYLCFPLPIPNIPNWMWWIYRIECGGYPSSFSLLALAIHISPMMVTVWPTSIAYYHQGKRQPPW
jgi:hypothetical protein